MTTKLNWWGGPAGRHRKALAILLVALACFSVAALANPKEAQASHPDWYEVDGQWCYWTGSQWDGCEFLYGGYIYYEKYTTGQILILLTDGTYMDQAQYWRSLGWAPYEISFNTGSSAFNLIPQLAGVTGTVAWSNGRAAMSGSEAIPQTPPDAVATQDANRAGKPRIAENSPDSQPVAVEKVSLEASGASTSARALFPHKVAQDNSKSFDYDKTWRQVRTKKALGRSYRVSSSKSRIATFEASGITDAGGSTMEFITATGPKMGVAKVQVVNLAAAKVVKQVSFDLRTNRTRFKVEKKISGLTPHKPYGLVIRSANGRPVVVDAVGYRSHGNMCHSVVE